MSLAEFLNHGFWRPNSSAWPRVRLFALCALLCACGGEAGNADTEKTASIYASLDSTQCGTVKSPLSSLSSRLTAGGVTVVSASCGSDGVARGAVCGEPDGRIGVFSVPASQQASAVALGFAPLGDLPGASVGACPAGGS